MCRLHKFSDEWQSIGASVVGSGQYSTQDKLRLGVSKSAEADVKLPQMG